MPDDQTPLEDLLRRRPWEGGAEGELCGDPELLAAYAEGQLPLKARERLEQHLAACAACQAAVVRLVRLAPQESAAARAASGTQTSRAPRISPVFRWRWALPTLAGVILVGSVIYYERFQIVSPRPSTPPARIADQVAPASELPTGPEALQTPAPKARAEVATSRSGPPGEADKGRPVGGTSGAVASEEERWRQQAEQDPKGNFAFYKAPTKAPFPAAPSPSFATAPRSEADRLEHLESFAQRKLKKESEPQALDDAVAQGKAEVRAKTSVANELTNRRRAQTAPKPSRSKELGRGQAAPKNAAKSVMAREGRLAERADVAAEAQEKGTRRAGGGGRQYASAPSLEEGAGAATQTVPKPSLPGELKQGSVAPESKDRPALPAAGDRPVLRRQKALNAQSMSPFVKVMASGGQGFALTYSDQIVTAVTGTNRWKPLTIPTGEKVTDFDLFENHLWVLLAGGQVAHSANLGRSWDPVVETGAKDPATISFTNSRAGEIQTRSGRRLRTTDGGQSWQPVQK